MMERTSGRPHWPGCVRFLFLDQLKTFLLQYKQITEQMHNCVIDCLRGERDDVVTITMITMIITINTTWPT